MITPSGSPSWVRTNNINHYGGNVDKENYLSRGAIDALTDVDAAQFCRLTADVSALQRVAPFCSFSLTCNDSLATAPTIDNIIMQTGIASNYLGSSPPSGFPAFSRNADGDVTLTLSTTYSDQYAVVGAFSVSTISCSLMQGTYGKVTAERVSDTIIRFRATDNANAAIVNAKISAVIW